MQNLYILNTKVTGAFFQVEAGVESTHLSPNVGSKSEKLPEKEILKHRYRKYVLQYSNKVFLHCCLAIKE